MKRAGLAVLVALFLTALAWPITRGAEAEAGVFTVFSPAGLPAHPPLAPDLSEALRSGDAVEVGRVEDLLRAIRSVHGCEGDEAPPRARPGLPPGHPPTHGPFTDEEQPAKETPLFEAPGIVTI